MRASTVDAIAAAMTISRTDGKQVHVAMDRGHGQLHGIRAAVEAAGPNDVIVVYDADMGATVRRLCALLARPVPAIEIRREPWIQA